MRLAHSGKVRDVYADGNDLILVASDRVSVYDVVLPTPIPDKGRVLTRLSLWWFEQMADVIDNHVIRAIDGDAEDVPEEWRGRAIRCRRLDMVAVECVARGYLTGSLLAEYRKQGKDAMEAARLEEPIFTPTTKAPMGQHDEPMTYDDVVAQEGADQAAELKQTTLAIYNKGAEMARRNGIIIADTKLEFGRDPQGRLVLADELLTPDSSRFWAADGWQPGETPDSYDKQIVRDWATSTGWDKTSPGPAIPEDVVRRTRDRYIEVYERLTGTTW